MPNRIRELREERKMTQIRLSIELEVAQETISAYENEKHYPSFLQLVKLSQIFSASIDYIMGLSEVRRPEVAANTLLTAQNSDEEKILAVSRRLSEPQVEQVLAYMQGMLDGARLQADSPPNNPSQSFSLR